MNHGLFAVEHPLIHVDVDHQTTVLDFIAVRYSASIGYFRGSSCETAEPVTLVRSPFTNKLSGSG